MNDTAISVENISKYYRLGLIGGRTLQDDLARKWAQIRGKPDPLLKIGQEDHGNVEGEYLWALRDINLEVKQGEILGIIGKNGSGKTTLLKILGKITAPTDGRVKLNGRLGCLIAVGTGFHPELTGRENIYLNGAILGMKKYEVKRKFDEIVDFSGVEKFIDTPIKRYSSGMNVRLGFSVAAYLDPEILLVDEVLAVGDAEFQKRCLGKMGEVAKEGRTVLFVSHNMASIKQLCSKVILLVNGEVKKNGDPFEIVNHYLSLSSNNFKESPIVDLKDYKNRHGTGEVTLKWAMLQGTDNEANQIFSIGENLKLVFELEANGRDSNFTILIQIRSSDGTPICKIFDHYCGFKAQKITPNSSTISVCFEDIRFYPDQYFVSITLRSYQGEYYDLAKDCLCFEIIDGGIMTYIKLNKIDGRIFLTPEWEYVNKKP
jgi:lipopolysaccharide transport system ATP-binding protein